MPTIGTADRSEALVKVVAAEIGRHRPLEKRPPVTQESSGTQVLRHRPSILPMVLFPVDQRPVDQLPGGCDYWDLRSLNGDRHTAASRPLSEVIGTLI